MFEKAKHSSLLRQATKEFWKILSFLRFLQQCFCHWKKKMMTFCAFLRFHPDKIFPFVRFCVFMATKFFHLCVFAFLCRQNFSVCAILRFRFDKKFSLCVFMLTKFSNLCVFAFLSRHNFCVFAFSCRQNISFSGLFSKNGQKLE